MNILSDDGHQDERDSSHSPASASLNLSKLEAENKSLRSELLVLQSQRKHLHQLKRKIVGTQIALEEGINASLLQQENAFYDFQSALELSGVKQLQLENMQQCSMTCLNDCVNISTQGPFATINGLRLGGEALADQFDFLTTSSPTTASPAICALCEGTSSVKAAPATADMPSVLSSTFSYSRGASGAATAGEVLSSANPSRVKVPWSEINSALGQLALLLKMMEIISNCGISYRHEISCMGSTSKMGIRRSATSISWYNLFSDDSFQFFGRRSFNMALNCLIQCVGEAAERVRQQDPTITLPHPIETVSSGGGTNPAAVRAGEVTVGGLSVAYGTDGVQWTRAMKYLLTDVKHLLLFPPFGLWNSTAQSSNITPFLDPQQQTLQPSKIKEECEG